MDNLPRVKIWMNWASSSEWFICSWRQLVAQSHSGHTMAVCVWSYHVCHPISSYYALSMALARFSCTDSTFDEATYPQGHSEGHFGTAHVVHRDNLLSMTTMDLHQRSPSIVSFRDNTGSQIRAWISCCGWASVWPSAWPMGMLYEMQTTFSLIATS